MGKVVHFEIPAADPGQTVEFFSKVFGWKFNKWGDMEYYLSDSGPAHEPGIEGAVMQWNSPDQPIVNTIQVDDLDDTIRKIKENGGQIVVPKQTIPGIGTHCYFRDPSGFIHGAMQSGTDPVDD